jgi:hypothetical protein
MAAMPAILPISCSISGTLRLEALNAATALGGELMGLPVGQIREAIWPTCCWSMAIRRRMWRSFRTRRD